MKVDIPLNKETKPNQKKLKKKTFFNHKKSIQQLSK